MAQSDLLEGPKFGTRNFETRTAELESRTRIGSALLRGDDKLESRRHGHSAWLARATSWNRARTVALLQGVLCGASPHAQGRAEGATAQTAGAGGQRTGTAGGGGRHVSSTARRGRGGIKKGRSLLRFQFSVLTKSDYRELRTVI